jgi:hypothetical protein
MANPKKLETALMVPAEVQNTIASAIKVEDGSDTASATNKPGAVRTTSTDNFGNKIEEH